ncbi:MAG: F0F1 ATP synthase subunit alpha [Myxococcales bacterium]|nr:F0F1 ATP synthase subunit alpha [Myxococcales bacterium]
MDEAAASFERALERATTAALAAMRARVAALEPSVSRTLVGEVVRVGDGVAVARGLAAPVAGGLYEVGDTLGRADRVDERELRLVLLARGRVEAGDVVRVHRGQLEVPAGPGLIGRVVDALGRPIDDGGPLRGCRPTPVDGPAPALIEREVVSRPLCSGQTVIDAMIPLGLGQRQLVIGDRSTGKTELCLDILGALEPTLVGVYVAIGRRGAEVANTVEWLRARGFFARGFVVVADADDPIGLIHLAPYTACAMAEALMRRGRDVVIVYDDLTTHAHAHRTLSLLLGRPVGREAHPVDVFHAHAHLLERATQLGRAAGGGSLTALAIAETQAGDLSAYIPTNLVSITDGQLRLDAALAAAGQLPAVDVGLSVSRVGGKAQPTTLRRLAGRLKNRYAQFLELEQFARFGSRLEGENQRALEWGRRVRALLAQERGRPRGWGEMIVHLLLLESGAERLPLDAIAATAARASVQARAACPESIAALDRGEALEDDALARVRASVRGVVEEAVGGAMTPDQEDT